MEEKTQQLIELLSESELEHFESLAPSYKKIFVQHAFKSKVEKTRLKNIDEVKEALELKCKNIHEYKKMVNPQRSIAPEMSDEEKIELYFEKIEKIEDRKRIKKLYKDLVAIDSDLHVLYAWNNPMINYKEAFNCGISVAKAHITLAFDQEAYDMFFDQIKEKGYGLNKKTFTIRYDQEIDFDLLREMVIYSIGLRKNAKGFWK